MQVPSAPCPHLACRLGCLHQGLSGPRGWQAQPLGRPVPLSWLLSLQIIMVRLQRVTFLALHNYLGLTTELFNPVSVPASHHGSSGQPLLPQGAGQQTGQGGVSWDPVLSLSRGHAACLRAPCPHGSPLGGPVVWPSSASLVPRSVCVVALPASA